MDAFLVLCNRVGLKKDDLEDMTISMCIDYIDEYIESQKPDKEKIRKASQSDFDSF